MTFQDAPHPEPQSAPHQAHASPAAHDLYLVLLVGLAAGIFLLAAFGMYLAQDTASPLPWQPPTETFTITPIPPTATITLTPAPTQTATRRPTYTPRLGTATLGAETPGTSEATQIPASTATPGTPGGATSTLAASLTPPPAGATPTSTQSSGGGYPGPVTNTPIPTATTTDSQPPTSTLTPQPGADTPTPTPTSTGTTGGPTPTATETITEGDIRVQGRVVQNGTPVANVTLEINEGDFTVETDTNGYYQFDLPKDVGEPFLIDFFHASNDTLDPSDEIAEWVWVEKDIEEDDLVVQVPDIEISLRVGTALFQPTAPDESASFSLAQVYASNPIVFGWSAYHRTATYTVKLGYDDILNTKWDSSPTNATTANFIGSTAVTTGYDWWWTIEALYEENDCSFHIHTQTRKIVLNP